MNSGDLDAIERLLGRRPQALRAVSGGDIARSQCAEFAGGGKVMLKFARPGQPSLRLEARMLEDLRAAGLPVPDVLATDDGLLALAWVEQAEHFDDRAQREAGRAIAQLHAKPTAGHFGYEYATVMGSLAQPNPLSAQWRSFFRDQRLLYQADAALAVGRLPSRIRHRIDTLAARLSEWIPDGVTPSLVHGDLWGGNMLARREGGVCFIDPAIYWGDGEMDLALATLFNSVGPAFFEGYAEVRPLREGFFEVRRELYNLYPLLVHVELFGGSYVAAVERVLSKFGC